MREFEPEFQGERPVDEWVERVLERLRRPRVGLLSFVDLPPAALGPAPLTWVVYLAGGALCAPAPFYRLTELAEPEREAETLSALAVPICSAPLLLELRTGVYASPESRLVAGCLDRDRPVVAGVAHLAERLLPGGAARRRFDAALADLSASGISFLSGGAPLRAERSEAERAPSPKASSEGILLLEEPGWTTWREISGRLRGIRRLLLDDRVRLTPEARENCAKLGIRIERHA
jgi:hypothetical protein